MKFDKWDQPKVRTDGVEVGPSSQLPVTHNSGSGAVAQGFSDLAQAAMTFQKERQKANLFKARQAELRFAESASVIENDFRNRLDESALDTADTRDKIEELRQKFAGELQDEEAREDYDQRTRLRVLGMVDGIEKHAADRRVKIYGAVADGALTDMKKSAIKDYNNPEKIELALKLGLSTMMEYLGGHLKLPDAVVEKTLDEAQAQVYSEVLKTYQANKQFSAGKDYLDKIKEHLGDAAPEWEAAFNNLTDAQAIEDLSTKAWAQIQNESTDRITGRFNPTLARAALVELYSPEDRSKIESEIEKEINVAVAAQGEQDDQRIAALSRDIRRSGSFSRTDPNFLALDQIGKDKVEADEEMSKRIRANDTKEQRLQRTFNKLGMNAYLIIPPSERVKLTQAQIESLHPGMDELGVSDILKTQAQEKTATAKKLMASSDSFHRQLFDIEPAIKKNSGRYGEKYAARFRERASAWWTEQTAEGKSISQDEVNKFLGSELLILDFTLGDKPAFAANDEERKKIKAADIEDQVYEQAKALLRGDYDKPAAPSAPDERTFKTRADGKKHVIRNGKPGWVTNPLPSDQPAP